MLATPELKLGHGLTCPPHNACVPLRTKFQLKNCSTNLYEIMVGAWSKLVYQILVSRVTQPTSAYVSELTTGFSIKPLKRLHINSTHQR